MKTADLFWQPYARLWLMAGVCLATFLFCAMSGCTCEFSWSNDSKDGKGTLVSPQKSETGTAPVAHKKKSKGLWTKMQGRMGGWWKRRKERQRQAKLKKRKAAELLRREQELKQQVVTLKTAVEAQKYRALYEKLKGERMAAQTQGVPENTAKYHPLVAWLLEHFELVGCILLALLGCLTALFKVLHGHRRDVGNGALS